MFFMKEKVLGLVGVRQDDHLSGGLTGCISDNCGERRIERIVSTSNHPIENAAYHGRLLDRDLITLNSALIEILEIAKNKGYEDIRKIIEEREYEQGHDSEFKDPWIQKI